MKDVRAVVAALVVITMLSGAAVSRSPAGAATTSAAPMLTRAEATSLLAELFADLEDAHPDLYSARSKRAVDADVSAAQRGFGERVSRVDFFRAAAPIVASLGDMHTAIQPLLPEYAASLSEGSLFPLALRVIDRRAVVLADLEARPQLPAGATVIAINGTPMDEILRRLGRYVSADGDAARDARVADAFRPLLWMAGIGPPYMIRFRTDRSTADREAAVAGTTSDRIRAVESGKDGDPFGEHALTYARGGRVAVVTLHDFDPAEVEWLDDAFSDMSRTGVRSLVIDLRWNAGGSTKVGDELLRHLARAPYRQISTERVKISTFVKRTIGDEEFSQGYGTQAPAGSVVTIDPGATSDYADETFSGDVYVLVGSGTFSAAAMFAAAAQDLRVATIAGEPSGGNATAFGEPVDFTLPRLGLAITVSTKWFARPAGPAAPRMVIPDVALVESAQLDPDPELAALVALTEAR